MSDKNRRWIYSKPVAGNLTVDNFELVETPTPTLRQGQALVRNRLVSLDPANRVYFARQTYRPQIQIGDVMGGFALGEVIESTDNRFKPGDLIHGDLGWQDYAVVNSYDRSEFYYKCTPGYSEDDLLGVLGITGLTAYFGLREFGPVTRGQTIVVAGATGACGVIVAQLAKIAGARVVGFGGGREKCNWLLEEIGLDAAIDYRDADFPEKLAAACPNGVDFFSDAIGGRITEATIPLMKDGASWYHYGNLTTYDSFEAPRPVAATGATPALADLLQKKRIHPSFLLVFDFYGERKKAEAEMAGYLADGRLKAITTTLTGLEELPRALVEGTLGANRYGKLNVRLVA